MAGPDLSNIPSADLEHIAKGDMSKVSEPVLRYLSGQPQGGPVDLDKNGSVLAGPVGTVLKAAMSPLDVLAEGTMGAVRGTVAPIAGLAARVPAALQGKDTDVASQQAHQAVERAGAYTPQTPAGQAGADFAGAVGRTVAAPFGAAANTIENAVGPEAAKVIESASSKFNDVVGSLPAVGALREVAALRGVDEAAPIARQAVDAAHEAGYTGLKTRADMKTPGSQAITDQLIRQEAGVVPGSDLNVAAVDNARTIGPGRVYDAAERSLPARMTQDAELQRDLRSAGGDTSQLPSSKDVDALRTAMLEQPEMSNQELFANIREARSRSAKMLAADNPDQNTLGHAYGRIADAYESFAGRRLNEAPPGAPSLADFQNARVAFAKNYLAREALKGGEHFDPAVYGNAARGNPGLLTGSAKIVGDAYNTLPAAGGDAGARAVGALGGAGAGLALEHFLGPAAGIPAGVSTAVTGTYVAPAVNNLIRRFFTRGNPEAAASAATNPRLSYQYASPLDRANALFGGRPTPNMELAPGPGTVGVNPQQGSLGDLLQGPPAAPRMDLAPPPGQPVEPLQRELGALLQGQGAGPANVASRLKESAERGHARPGPATPPASSPPGQPGPQPLPEPYSGRGPAEGTLPKRLSVFAKELAKRLGDEF
jgi:hypothetical protein